jgi:hypothetical protein
MANPTVSQKLRASMGGKAWRTYEITHTGNAANSLVYAASMDLDYIECIIGVNSNFPVSATGGSFMLGMMDISIAANHDSIVWIASTIAGYQTITVVGW